MLIRDTHRIRLVPDGRRGHRNGRCAALLVLVMLTLPTEGRDKQVYRSYPEQYDAAPLPGPSAPFPINIVTYDNRRPSFPQHAPA